MASSKVDMDQWQCGKSLPECLGFMFEKEIACDVTFIVGEQKTEMKAHKTILISRSPVFYAMLNGPLKETDTDAITVPDIEKDAFKEVLRYIYTDKVNLTAEIFIPVSYAAKKYCLDSLSQLCLEYVESSISEENIFVLYEQAHLYDDQNLENTCMDKIKRNPKKCLGSPSFLELCHTCCQKVVASDDLCCPEEFIYERVIEWSEAECLRRQIENSDANKRKVLAGMLYKIRLPLLNKAYLGRHLLNSDLLTSEEKLEVVKHHYNALDSPTMFINKERKRQSYITSEEKLEVVKHHYNALDSPTMFINKGGKMQSYKTVIRFENCRFFYSVDQLPEKIGFTISKDAVLHGVVLYGDDKSSEYSVDLSIKDYNETTLSSMKTKYTACLPNCTSNILLHKPVVIRANTEYKITAIISGPNSMRGTGGREKLYINTAVVKFFAISGGHNFTSEVQGQIPGLLLSFERCTNWRGIYNPY